MSNVKIIGPNVPNMPWQERPADNQTGLPLCRYNENPIIGRNPAPGVARIFNSAVMPYEDGFIGVFRGEQTNGVPYIYLGKSEDAIHWNFEENKIPFKDEDGNDIVVYHARTETEIEGNPLYNPNRHAHLMQVQWDENGKPVFAYD